MIDKSPCIGTCRLDEHERCISCRRHKDDLLNWSGKTPGQRDQINRINWPEMDQAVKDKLLK